MTRRRRTARLAIAEPRPAPAARPCRMVGVPGHVCAGEVRLYLAGNLCAAAAPGRRPTEGRADR